MLESAIIGKTKVKLWDFEQIDSSSLYKVQSRQKIRNILVDCDYFENKGIDSAKSISFLVVIKVFGTHPSRPVAWYEMYGNTAHPKYNHVNRCSKTKDFDLTTEDEARLDKLMQVIKGEFDDYTVNFINCAQKLIKGKGTISTTPKFIKDVIDEVRDIMQSNAEIGQ